MIEIPVTQEELNVIDFLDTEEDAVVHSVNDQITSGTLGGLDVMDKILILQQLDESYYDYVRPILERAGLTVRDVVDDRELEIFFIGPDYSPEEETV